jgi:hypothetical protein
MFSMRTILS